uniref:Uncharacterized protein n=1 Tax=Lepeophtheirus salmonis TaxID=72036 RepID=A0A0K2U521_LEPSM
MSSPLLYGYIIVFSICWEDFDMHSNSRLCNFLNTASFVNQLETKGIIVLLISLL